MTVKVYASGVLAYDSQLPEEKHYSMLSIRIQEGLNKGGTAKLILPPDHRLYNGFPAMRTPVEIYRNDKLRWRGRPLPHSDDFYGRRTITCEGEMCFLNDATMRPYMLAGTPAQLFAHFLTAYNAAVAGDPWKQFAIGEVTVVSDADVELSAANPEQVYTSVQKLIKQCGGYIFFDSTEAGLRRINWYAEMPYRCDQPVRFGENLLDYSSSASVSGLATRIIPYGAKDDSGTRLQINVDGKDYVDNLDAQAQRGIIEKPVIYEGITDAATLQAMAEADVMTSGTIPETLQLSALDLSRFDTSIDSFAVGQIVRAQSDVHDLTGEYALVALDEDLVQPGVGTVTLTQDVRYYDGYSSTLSGSLSNEIAQQDAQRVAATLDAVNQATAWLTNGKGYKVERVDANGNSVDTLYMDTPDINTAVNVLRIGQSGIGFSHNGVNGPYVSFWTIDAKFNADCITAGTLNAALVKIINLIVDHLLSEKDGTSLEITGAEMWLKKAAAYAVFQVTSTGYARLAMSDGADYYGELTPRAVFICNDPETADRYTSAQLGIDPVSGCSYADAEEYRLGTTETIKDHIIEVATSGSFTYRKYSSGLAEGWGSATLSTVPVTTAWGNVFSSGAKKITLPSVVNAVPDRCELCLLETSSGVLLDVAGAPTQTATQPFYFVSGTSKSGITAKVGYRVVWQWQ